MPRVAAERLAEIGLTAARQMHATDPRPLDRAKAISALISAEALTSERLGRLTDKVAAAMLDANLFSIRLPVSAGGLSGSGVDLFEATEEIARADGSAGWCVLISNTANTFVHTGTGIAAHREVFEGDISRGRWRVSGIRQFFLGIEQFSLKMGRGCRADQ